MYLTLKELITTTTSFHKGYVLYVFRLMYALLESVYCKETLTALHLCCKDFPYDWDGSVEINMILVLLGNLR